MFHPDIVIYHKSCADGTAASWPFWRENKQRFHKKDILLLGYSHDDKDPPDTTNKNVVLVDFCFKRSIIEDMICKVKSLTIIDHHDSTIRNIGDKNGLGLELIFDENYSAAQLVWDYFYPHENRPWFIDAIADRDLWRLENPETGPLTRAMFKMGYYRWNNLEKLYRESPSIIIPKLLQIGIPLYESDRIEMLKICSRAVLAKMTTPSGKEYTVKLVSCDNRMLKSDVGNHLANSDCDFAVMWSYDFAQDSWWISTRASVKSKINLAEICEEFWMGGGHTKAAGFAIGPNKHLKDIFSKIEK